MKKAVTVAILLLVLGCATSSGVTVELDGPAATVVLPKEPKTVHQKVPLKLYTGDPTKRPSTKVRVVKNGEKKPPGPWKEYPYEVKVTLYEIKELDTPWGAEVYEFPAEALKELGPEKLLDFARTQIIPPGHFVVGEETSRTFDTLPARDVMGRATNGTIQVEGRLILKGATVYVAQYTGRLSVYPKDLPKQIMESLKVKP